MKFVRYLAYALVVIGALNWGLWGFFQFDLVAWLFDGNTSWLSRIVYSIVGLGGVYTLFSCSSKMCGCSCCSTDKGSKGGKGGCCKM